MKDSPNLEEKIKSNNVKNSKKKPTEILGSASKKKFLLQSPMSKENNKEVINKIAAVTTTTKFRYGPPQIEKKHHLSGQSKPKSNASNHKNVLFFPFIMCSNLISYREKIDLIQQNV